jgi:virginiamycin B lyase
MRRLAPVLAAILTLAAPSAARAAVTEYPLPAGSSPLGIAQAPDGSLWAVEDGDQAIARVAPDGTVTRFGAAGYTSLIDATVDLTGSLWFTGGDSDRLGRAATGAALGPISTWHFGNGCDPSGVATAPDGGVWVTKRGCDVVLRIAAGSAASSGHDDVHVPYGTGPLRIAPGPDGAMWFTAYGSGRIGRIAADGSLTWPVPGGLDRPYDIVTGPDGNLWVTESGGAGAILRVTPAGAVTRFSDGLTDGAEPQGIAASTDGNLYVAAYRANAIARVSTTGAITEIPLRAGAGPRGVAPAADGTVWFTAYDGGWIGHLTHDPPPPEPVPAGPTPELGRTVVATPTRGTVRVTLPGARRSFVLRQADDIPVGSTLDTRSGRVSITTALPEGTTQRGNFWGGFFRVRQSRRASLRGMTTLELRSRLTCGTRARAAARRKRNSLWGSDRRGRFRTHGRNATATVRGTVWSTTDRCDGTLVTVQSGSVRVRDRVLRRTVTVRGGHSYLARNR